MDSERSQIEHVQALKEQLITLKQYFRNILDTIDRIQKDDGHEQIMNMILDIPTKLEHLKTHIHESADAYRSIQLYPVKIPQRRHIITTKTNLYRLDPNLRAVNMLCAGMHSYVSRSPDYPDEDSRQIKLIIDDAIKCSEQLKEDPEACKLNRYSHVPMLHRVMLASLVINDRNYVDSTQVTQFTSPSVSDISIDTDHEYDKLDEPPLLENQKAKSESVNANSQSPLQTRITKKQRERPRDILMTIHRYPNFNWKSRSSRLVVNTSTDECSKKNIAKPVLHEQFMTDQESSIDLLTKLVNSSDSND
ncbi:hypothetical protein GJ496_001368 [Pomphorhynchus laevis]|nr:hypothetical protein GJ496_001368 [Pomphorhynchus laevis]